MNSFPTAGVMGTRSGQAVDVRFPVPSSILIEDICYGLGNIYRFNGQSDPPISVAEHSLVVYHKVWSKTKSPYFGLCALLHDAEEAYLGDMPSPIKAIFPDYCEVAENLRAAIYKRFELAEALARDPSIEIVEADHEAYEFDRGHFMPPTYWWPNPHGDCGCQFVRPMPGPLAGQRMLEVFRHLQKLRKENSRE